MKRALHITTGLGISLVLGSWFLVLAQAQTPPPPPVCPNGILEAGELCDQQATCSNNPSQNCNTDSQCPGGACVSACTAECGIKLLGWSWSDSFGWLSLNRDSCYYLHDTVQVDACEPSNQPNDYYLEITPAGVLKGFAWSDNVGWVCVGESCNGLGSEFGTLIPGSCSGNGSVCEQGDPAACNGSVDGTCDAPTGWAASVLNEGDPNNVVVGWAKNLVSGMGDQAWFSLSCRNENPACNPDNVGNYGVRVSLREFSPTGDASIRTPRYSLAGFAWNGNAGGTGLGWLSFDPAVPGVTPFLQTKFGDVYSLRGIQRTVYSPYGCIATYRILSDGSIQNVCSELGLEQPTQDWVTSLFGQINFPTPGTGNANVLGRIDVTGLTCDVTTGGCTNRYGHTVQNLDTTNLSAAPLGGKVYYAVGNYTVSSAQTFQNGTGFEKGAGTIIVNGDLTISANIDYSQVPSSRLRNIASVAWIVRGDLKIDPGVTRLAGNFIVLGDGSTLCTDADPTSCGQLFSCFGGGACDQQLVVSGLVMARQYSFARTFASPTAVPYQGSEVILYDGRLLTNIPPGLEDFAGALPVFRPGGQ